MKKTPFGAFLTPALTGRPPAEIRIDHTLLRDMEDIQVQWQGKANASSSSDS
jgi:hypothetical protein